MFLFQLTCIGGELGGLAIDTDFLDEVCFLRMHEKILSYNHMHHDCDLDLDWW